MISLMFVKKVEKLLAVKKQPQIWRYEVWSGFCLAVFQITRVKIALRVMNAYAGIR